MTLILAFKYALAEEIFTQLKLPDTVDKIFLDSSVESIGYFIATTNFSQYEHIIGLGMYPGRDQNKIRIETECTNQFRNNKENLEKLNIPYFIQPNEHMKLAKSIGNSWCNLVSYRLIKAVPDTRYTFLHIPKRFDPFKASRVVETQLELTQGFNRGLLGNL